MKKQAFSLVELSIVLVILGLLVGGILSGQALIKAAALRAQIAQVDSIRVAVNTFKDKYFAIPGDMAIAQATTLGFYAPTTGTPGAYGYGDNNGQINSGNGVNEGGFVGEPIMFWRQLSDAKLIEGAYGASISTAAAIPADQVGTAAINGWIPPAKIGNGASLMVMSENGINYLAVSGVNSINTSPISGSFTLGTNPMVNTQVWGIDTKVDDGKPTTGSVTAINGAVSTFNNACAYNRVCSGTITSCISGNTYVLDETDNACGVSFRLSR